MKPIILGTGEDFLRREGLGVEPEPWEDGLRADTGPGSFEWWYFDAQFDDGLTAVITYATKPLFQRQDPLTPMVTLAITQPDGRKYSFFLVYPSDQFRAAQDRCDVRIGPNWIQGDLHRYELHAEGQGLAADLTFTGIVPPWRPGAGKNYYDAALTRYFAWLPAIPFGQVTGTLTYDGQTRQVRGTGYHDHNWGNIGLDQIVSHWYWGRAHLGDYTLIFVEMVSNRTYGRRRLPVFMLAKGDKILIGDGSPLTLQTAEPQHHPSGHAYPRRLDFHWQAAAGTVHLALREPQTIEATSLLGTLPKWKQWLVRLFANPYYFRFKANLELTISLVNEKGSEHGPALYELMILR